MATKEIALAAAGFALGALGQEPRTLAPRDADSTDIVAVDGTKLVRQDVARTQRMDALFIDFDLVDAKGAVVARGTEQVIGVTVDGKAKVVRHVLLEDTTVDVVFSPIEGETISWIRHTGCWRIPDGVGYRAVRRTEDGTLVIDQVDGPLARTTIVADEWDDAYLEAFADHTATVDTPPDAIVQRATGGASRAGEPRKLVPRAIRSRDIVALDGKELVRRDVRREQLDDAMFIDFDVVDADGEVAAYGIEQTFAIEVEGRPRLVRQVLIGDAAVAVGFEQVAGEPIAWIRDAGALGWRSRDHEGYVTVRRADDRTFVLDGVGRQWRRITIAAEEWREVFVRKLFEQARVVDRPSDEILRRARQERRR